jgi:hypothetical protein
MPDEVNHLVGSATLPNLAPIVMVDLLSFTIPSPYFLGQRCSGIEYRDYPSPARRVGRRRPPPSNPFPSHNPGH